MTSDGIDNSEIQSLAVRLSRIPKEFERDVRKPLRKVGQQLLSDAQAASSWSSRIPGSLHLRVALGGGRKPGVSVRASLKAAPHARVYEGILADSFVHPLFGEHGHMYPEGARSYLLPAVQANTDRIVDEISRLVDDVHRRAGLG